MRAAPHDTLDATRRGAFGASLALHALFAGAVMLPFLSTTPIRPAAPDGVEVVWVPSGAATQAAPNAPDEPAAHAAPDAAVEAPAPVDAPVVPPPPIITDAVAPLPAPIAVAALPPPPAPDAEPVALPPPPVPAPIDAVPPPPPAPPAEAPQRVAALPPPPPAPQPVSEAPPPQRQPVQAPRRAEAAQRAARPAPSRAATRQDVGASSAAAVAAAAPPAAPPGPVLITAPRYRHPPTPPAYPPRALEFGLTGTVLVRARVAPDGSTEETRIWRSSGHALLDAAAVAAVRRWAFEPASVEGRRVEAWVEVPVHFRLN